MPANKLQDGADVVRALAQGLRQAATRPNIHGYRPHAKQLLFHKSTAKIRLFIGGNRSGKTVGGATESVQYARREHAFKTIPWNEPIRGRIVAVDFLNGVQKIVLPEVARWIPPSMLKNGSWEDSYAKQERTLYLEDGGFIEFMSYDQELDKFAGTSRHFTWFDEEPPEDIYKECMARLIDTGGHAWLTMTPVEGMTWVFDQIYEKRFIDPNIYVVEVDMTENPVLGKAEIDAYVGTLNEDEVEARMHGKFVRRGGLIYPNFDPQINVIDPFIPPRQFMHFEAMDHGFNNPTAWLWMAVSPDGDIFVYDEHYESGQVVSYHALKVHEKRQSHRDPEGIPIFPSYSIGDPSIQNTDPIGGGSVQAEYMEYGIPIALGNNDVKTGLNRTARYFGNQRLPGRKEKTRPRLYVCRNCVMTLWELGRYSWAMWAQKGTEKDKNKKEEPKKKDDHAMDALRYGVMSRPEADTGEEIPEMPNSMGAPEAVDPYSTTDPDAGEPRTQWEYSDYTLGSEY